MTPPFVQRIASAESPALLAKSWLFCALYCAIAFPVFYVFAFKARDVAGGLVGGFFAVFGVVYLWITVQKTLEFLKLGEISLRLEGEPPALGGMLTGRLLWPARGVRQLRVGLAAVERMTETDGKGKRVTRDQVRWEEETLVPVRAEIAAFSVRVPDAPEVERGAEYRWKLRVRAELPGVDLDREFPVDIAQPPPGRPTPAPRPAMAAAPAPQPEVPMAAPRPVAAPLLIAANLVPLYGVFALDWRIGDVVILYWIENLVIGLFNILRILSAQPDSAAPGLLAGKLALAGFFLVHYGAFCAGHGVFLAAMFPVTDAAGRKLDIDGVVLEMLRDPGLLAAVAALVISHGYSFVRNYLGREEYRHVNVGRLMSRPYGRIVVVHVFVIVAGFVVQGLRSPVAALLIFIALKTAIDFQMHRRERRLLATPPAAR